MQPSPYPQNKHFDAEASREAVKASRAAAERIVRENQARAEHFASTGTAPAPDDAIAAIVAGLNRSLAGEA